MKVCLNNWSFKGGKWISWISELDEVNRHLDTLSASTENSALLSLTSKLVL